MSEEATLEGADEEEIDQKIDDLLNNKPATEEAQDEEEAEKDKPDGESEEDEEPEKEAEESTLTLPEISEVLGIDVDKLDVDANGKIVLKTKIDGVEGKVSLNDAIKSYQLEGHLNKQNMEVVNQRKALEAEHQAFQQERQQKTKQLEDVITLAVNEMNRDYQSINWDQLKVADPNQFLILKQEYQDRQNNLQQTYQHLIQTREQESIKFHAVREKKLAEEAYKLRSQIPGWDNDETYKAGTQEVRNTLLEVGFSQDEIEAASHGLSIPPEAATKLFVLAHKASEYDKLQKAKSGVIKKIRTAPKVVKGGPVETNSKTSIKNILDTVKKSGGEKGIDDYLKAKGIV